MTTPTDFPELPSVSALFVYCTAAYSSTYHLNIRTNTMQVKFCGAAREVTGSCHLITLDNGKKILLDCGLYQGRSKEMEDFNENWLFDPPEIDILILSHAHIDHSGRIPKLVKDGFQGEIHCTHATKSLCAIMLLDSAKIQESDAQYQTKIAKRKDKASREIKPLYTARDVHKTMNLFVGHGYDKWFHLNHEVEVQFRDAGHILGSASVTLKIRENGEETKVGFTGDIGRPARPILRDPAPMPEVDYLICESTYGDRLHDEAPAEAKKLLEIIKNTCVEKKGKLIIPAFSVGRTQEIVYMLDQMETAGMLPPIPVYVDSPLAVNATVVFGTHPECYDAQLHDYMLIDPNPFGFNKLQYVHSVEGSKALNTMKKPAIIISASGMMTAGRVVHHLFNNIEDPKSTLLIVGYCAPGTTGGHIRAGNKSVYLFGQHKQILADVEIMDSFSAHGDRDEMTWFIKNQEESVKKIFLVHGNYDAQVHFQDHLAKFGFKDVEVPSLGQTFTLH